MLRKLKTAVCQANLELVEQGLVTLTWGNVSGLSDDGRYMVIKPSGVPYAADAPEQMVVVDLDGNVVEGELRPSSDTPTHLCCTSISRAWAGSRTRTAPRPRRSPRRGWKSPAWARRTRIIFRTRPRHTPADRPGSGRSVRGEHGASDRRAICQPGPVGDARPCWSPATRRSCGDAMPPSRSGTPSHWKRSPPWPKPR